MRSKDLRQHPFVISALGQCRAVWKAHPDLKLPVSRDSRELPTELEFYILGVGNASARLLASCDQLEYSLALLSSFRSTDSLRAAGVTRAVYLSYIVESYIVFTQIVYERSLRLVDRFLYLGNDDSEIRHQAIIKNSRVQHTDIPVALKALHKHVLGFSTERHQIIHRGNFLDEDLNQLELFAILEAERAADSELQYLPALARRRTSEFLSNRKRRYQSFNSKALELVSDLLDTLERLRPAEDARVARATGG